jgi:hypothetical protein
MAAEARVLVVANRTAESPELLDALRTRTMQGPCEFTLLVPSTPHGIAWAADMHGAGEEAEEHRKAFVEELRVEGLNVGDAKVGDPNHRDLKRPIALRSGWRARIGGASTAPRCLNRKARLVASAEASARISPRITTSDPL